MRACNVDLDKLKRSLTAYLESELENLITDGAEDSKLTAGFQRGRDPARAVIHVQSSGREEVTGANVLVAIFAERESHAAYFLQEQMTRLRRGQRYQPRHRQAASPSPRVAPGARR